MDLGSVGFSVETKGSDEAVAALKNYIAETGRASRAAKEYTDQMNRFQKIRDGISSKETRDNMARTRAMISLGKQREDAYKREADIRLAEDTRILNSLRRMAEANDPVIRANNRHADSVDLITAARRRGLISIEEEERALIQAEHARNGQLNSLNQYMRDSRGAVQQLGYQVADFAVQVQSGTSFLVAMAQQGSQVLSMFGPTGAIAGAFLAVGSAIATTFLGAQTEVETLQEKLDDLKSAVEAVNKANENYTTEGLDKLREKYGEIDKQVLQLINNQSVYARMVAKKELKDALSSLSDVAGSDWYDIGISDWASGMLNVQEMFKLTRDDAISLKYAFDQLSTAEGYDQQLVALTRLGDYLRIVLQAQDNITQEQLDTYSAVIQATEAVKELANSSPKAGWMTLAESGVEDLVSKISSAKDVLSSISELAPKSNWLDSAITGVVNFMDKLREAASIRIRTLPIGGPITGGAGETVAPGGAGSDRLTGTGGGSGSSGSGSRTVTTKPTLVSIGTGSTDTLASLIRQIEAEKELLGLSEAQRRVQQALGDERSKYSEAEIAQVTAEIEALNAKQEVMKREQDIANVLKSSMEDAFMSMVDGTKSVGDAFKDMAKAIIAELFNVLVVQQLVGSWNSSTGTGSGLVGAIMSAFQADGGVWHNGSKVEAFADGGVVSRPTTFGMSGGRTGLMGEAGPEAIIPLKRGKDGKLGVAAATSGSSDIVINNNISVTGSDAAAVRSEVMKMLPQIANVTKASVLNARQRGGAFRDTFK